MVCVGGFGEEGIWDIGRGAPLAYELIDVDKFRNMSQATRGFWMRDCLAECVLRGICGLMRSAGLGFGKYLAHMEEEFASERMTKGEFRFLK